MQAVKKATKDNMFPQQVHLDFEEALSAGFLKVFPEATLMKDFFHFIQANVRKAGQLGLKSVAKEISDGLNVLWAKPTKEEFDSHLDEFLGKWDKRAPQYSGYFRSTWIQNHPPKDWASYARPSDARSGRHFVSFLLSFLALIHVDL
jgi:transposase-like protein